MLDATSFLILSKLKSSGTSDNNFQGFHFPAKACQRCYKAKAKCERSPTNGA